MGAGEGTRMWPISTMVNKHLLKLGGKPVIRHIWEKLDHEPQPPYFALIHDITIICLKKDLKDYQWEFRDVEVNLFPIEENTGTAAEVYEVVRNLKDEHFLLHYGDTVTDLDYKKMIEYWHKGATYRAMIAVTQNIKHDYSQVFFDEKTKLVTTIEEKPKLSNPSWTGIGIFNREYFLKVYENLDKGIEGYLDFGYHVLPAMIKKPDEHMGLFVYQYDGRWFDVGNLRSYQKLYKEYQNKDLNL